MGVARDVYVLAASRFLHSVVVVDDRARLGDDEDPVEEIPEEIIDPRLPLPVTIDDGDVAGSDVGAAAGMDAVHEAAATRGLADENRLDARRLIDGFAARGIVCAALRPEGTAAGIEDLVAPAAGRCDIVTLDWHITTPDDHGEKAAQLLGMLSEPDQRRLRLVAVYTGDPHATEIDERIRALGGVIQSGPFAYQRGSARIVVLFKEHARPNAEDVDIVPIDDLPERLVTEFARHCAGVVPAMTMSALGAVRENMHDILAVLSADLDPGFVGHRLSQQYPDDATGQLAELIVSEIRSVVDDDADSASTVGREAIDAWLDDRGVQLGVPLAMVQEMNVAGGSPDARRALAEKHPDYQQLKNRHPTILLTGGDRVSAEAQNAKLAERMAVRTVYSGSQPGRLELGVIVQSWQDGHYWVCVQPLCDSVRLQGDCRVPFLPYNTILDDKAFDLVLTRGDEVVRLALSTKPADISLRTFAVDGGVGAVMPLQVDGQTVFVDQDDIRLLHVCRLKPEQGQRLVHRLGTEFSRVGLSESEWQRLKAGGRPT